MWNQLVLLLVAVLGLVAAETDIITLDGSNFEHLTQAATGATTGDWLIKFYAPWCGHCKHMQPEYEKAATALKGEVNVAEVDVTKDRSLGSRFDVTGFPTLLFMSKGKIYKYKGPRTADALSTFVRSGYLDSKTEAGEVPQPVGYFGELTKVFNQAWTAAKKDISAGKYATINVLTCALPLLFLGCSALLALLPSGDEEPPKMRMSKPVVQESASSLPKETKSSDKKED